MSSTAVKLREHLALFNSYRTRWHPFMVPSSGRTYLLFPITQLFNLSLSTSTVPRQWKQAWIRPVPKVTAPTQHSDFRPISITPVLTRALERMIVHDFIYPALQNPTTSLVFHDQFAFRPSGSTTSAIITLLHKVTHLLLTNPYVIVIAFDTNLHASK